MKRIAAALAACAVLAFPALRAEEEAAVPYALAADFLGTEVTVEGVVKETHLSASSGNLFLNFGNYRKDLSVKIPRESFAKFPANAEAWYRGKKIRVTGTIYKERGLLRVTAFDPANLKVVEQ